jgi:hypothetical protein
MLGKHYFHARYFSGLWVFIPMPPAPPRPRTHVQKWAEPFPGFRFPNAEDKRSRSPSTEYEFYEGAELSPERQEEGGPEVGGEGLFVPEESSVKQEEEGGQQTEEELFVPETCQLDMAVALAWEEDEE